MTNKKLFACLIVLFISLFVYANPVEDGKIIFTSRCAACHNVNKVLTGPALAGVDQRRSMEWITKFIQSSQSLVKSGDKDAVALFQQFNRVPMPDHPDLTSDHIKSIVEYIKSESKPVGEQVAPFAKPGKREPGYKPLSLQKDYLIFLVYLAIVGMLIAVLLFAVHVNSLKQKTQNKKSW
ncbi:MAG TPA: cytochrome c [Chitinophagaceae bacterium]|nr:cytochrome c [Chitinophagaceae bacterium]